MKITKVNVILKRIEIIYSVDLFVQVFEKSIFFEILNSVLLTFKIFINTF